MAGYIVIAFLIAWHLLPRALTWISGRPELSQAYGVPIFALISALLFGWSAEYMGGVAAITGAFIAGVGLSKLQNRGMKHEIEQTMSGMAYVFLVPIFFVNVGLETDLSAFPMDALPFMLLLLFMAVVSKVFGAGFGARMGGFDLRESLRVGVCMVSRGEVGLIIISIGLTSGIIDGNSELYAALFMVILLTTVLTRHWCARSSNPAALTRTTIRRWRRRMREIEHEIDHPHYLGRRKRHGSGQPLARGRRARRHHHPQRRLIQPAAENPARQPGSAAAYRQLHDQLDGLSRCDRWTIPIMCCCQWWTRRR